MSKWDMVRLGDICTIARGGSPRPITAYITDNANGVNWIKIGDAELNSMYINRTNEKIKPEGIKKSRFVKKGDFILSNSMSFGRPYILNIDGCIHDGWLLIRDNNNTFDKRFLYYSLGSPFVYMQFKKAAVGGVVNNLNSDLVRKTEVPIPPLKIQKHIADILDKTQEIIDGHKKQLEELDNLIKATFYDMFGDPSFNDKGWNTDFLSNVAPIQQSKFNTVEMKNVWLLNLDAIKSNTGEIIEYLYIKPNEICNSTIMFDETNVLYSKLRPYLNKVVNPTSKGIGTSELVPFKPNPRIINKIFLTNILRSNAFLEFVNIKVAGAKMPRVVMGDLKEYKIILPPLPLQNKFATIVTNIEEQKAIVKQSITQSQNLFNSLMSKYFEEAPKN